MFKVVQRHVPEQKSFVSILQVGISRQLQSLLFDCLEHNVCAHTHCLAGHRPSETVSEPPVSATVSGQLSVCAFVFWHPVI